jgi:hypothetical protein
VPEVHAQPFPYRCWSSTLIRVSKRNPDGTTKAEAPVEAPGPYAADLAIAEKLGIHKGSIIYLLKAGPHTGLRMGTDVYVFELVP